MEPVEVEVANDNFHARAECFRVFIPGKEKTSAQGEKKKGSIPVYVRRITLNCKRSGAEIKFPVTRRGGVARVGDSRETANTVKGWTVEEFKVELSRMMGAAHANSLLSVVL